MIQKIICPTDFSPAAQNGVRYAANLAQAWGASLLLTNVQETTATEAIVEHLAGPDPITHPRTSSARETLSRLSSEIRTLFEVDVTYEVEVSPLPFQRLFDGADPGATLLVAGTNGADTFGQTIFGSHTFRLLKNWTGPLLAVPEGADYGALSSITFAWGQSFGQSFSLGALQEFVKAFSPLLHVVHVTTPAHNTDPAIYEALRKGIARNLGTETKILYEQMTSDDPIAGIKDYMNRSDADLLVVSHPGQSGSLSPLKRLFADLRHPLLVLPGHQSKQPIQ